MNILPRFFKVENINSIVEASKVPADTIQLNNYEFTEDNIIKIQDNIKVNKIPGPDRIAPRILKETKNQICKLLLFIFDRLLNSSKIPREWKRKCYSHTKEGKQVSSM